MKLKAVLGGVILFLGSVVAVVLCAVVLLSEWQSTGAGDTPYRGWGLLALVPIGVIGFCLIWWLSLLGQAFTWVMRAIIRSPDR